MKNYVIVLLLFCISGCANQTGYINKFPMHSVLLRSPSGEEIQITAEVADEPEEHARGLMGRKKLNYGSGILFVFTDSKQRNFWMKNTFIPLDIIFFDEEKMFVSRADMVPCHKDPCTLYSSIGDAKYALELPAGSLKKYEVGEGWKIIFNY